MKQQKKSWVKTLLSFAEPCKGKMILSVLCAIFSVAGGFIPFWAVYKILLLFINRTATGNYILLWCLVGVGGYLIRVLCFGISTILAHISAYTILEGIRLKIANRLMKAPLGEVMGRRIGYLKNIIMDKVEDLEPPLAHVIPELTSNLLLPLAIFVWMLAIDWRMGLSILIAPALAMIPMFFLMKNYNSQYAAYMEANNHVNNIIIEYVEGIEVVKAFNQSTSSYEKFVGAVKSFKDFTLNWFKSTWKTMNLMMAIMPTTLIYIIVAVGIETVMGLLFALFFELDYKGSKVIRSFLMAPLMIAPLVAGLTWKLMMSSSFGIVNELLARVGILSSSSDILWLADEKWSLLACCIADIWLTTPFMMLMILAGLQGLDSSMLEAAKIDGANKLQQIFAIKLPVIKPVLLTALSVRIIDAARTFDIIWAMTEGGPNSSSETISIIIYKTLTRYNDIGYASAMAVVFIVVLVVFTLVFMQSLWNPKKKNG